MKIKHIIIGIIVLSALGFVYSKFVSPTKVAFINFRDFQYAAILEAKDNPLIKVARITLKEAQAPNLNKYCAIYLFGMGLRLDEGQVARIKTAIEKGVKVYVYAATSAESDLTNLRGDDLKYIEGYFGNGGKKNLRRLLNYTRRVFDRKVLFTGKIKEAQVIPYDIFFHLGDENYFSHYKQYQKFYEEKGYFKEEAPKVCLVTTNIGPRNANREHVDMMIKDLEARGINVYPISGFLKRLKFIKEVEPSLVILIPHGRFVPGRADEAVRYLREKNIPLLCPINVFSPYDEWFKDQRGMSGGIMSQSIVVPELDGGIVPYVISAQFKNEDGLYVFKGLPNRIKTFCGLAEKWLKLKAKPNEEKRIAIYYFKGPGLNSMVAGGMEVAPSLLNLLRYLKKEGFDTGMLPENEKELLQIIQKQGPVLGVYAKGTFQKYLEEGKPELINKDIYLKWCRKDLLPEMFEDIVRNYGPAPGEYMRLEKDGKTYIAVARIRFGNVVILPQPLPGYGDNQSQLIHGAKKAPPHTYTASYLWVRNGFNADAIVHFGTHGSLEFTPYKQVALSEYDWPDALIAGIPHIYVYVVNNIGEAMIAKRRSYAVITSHLTPPFTESDLYGELSRLHNKFHNYIKTEDEALRSEYRKSIKKSVIKLGLHKDLGIEDFENKELTKDIFDKLHNHIHAIEQEKITRGLYTLGENYENEHIYETAKLMAIDSLSYSAAKLDLLKGRITDKEMNDAHYFDEVYRQKAVGIIDSILLKGSSAESFLDKDDVERLEHWDKSHQTMTDDEFFASMISLAQSDNLPDNAGPKEKTGVGSEKLKRLILKVAPYEEKKDLLLSLQDENKFKKMSSLLDPQSLKKAMKIAKVVPAMKEAIELAMDDDIRELLAIMQDETVRKQVFHYLKDKKMREEIKEEQKKLRQQIVQRCLEKTYWQDLFIAIDKDKLKDSIRKRDKSGLLDFKKHLEFYLKAAKLADDIASREGQNGQAVGAILKSKKSLELVKESLKKIEKEIARLDEREKEYVQAIRTYQDTLFSIKDYYKGIENSPEAELEAVVNALSGGYILPSSGGDPISNPQAVPTGKNLFAIDAEKTPTEESWKVGVKLARALIAAKLARTGKYPKKAAFTLWGGEFIRGGGTTIAEIFYLLGVEPVRNSRGVVYDVRLIPMEKLKRPRIDVVVQTSGQFRDIAASRIYLINKAVKLASEADDDGEYKNYVQEGTVKAEEVMKKKGLSPLEARLFSTARVFGGINGNYGTGIMGLVESGDKWEDEKEITDQYLKNMGGIYTKDNWGIFKPGAFEAALQNTDTVVHPRSSNVYGPLSLDHFYEFMGGLNATVRQVTGFDPDAYFSDCRNKNNPVVQNLKTAIWVETRTTLFNPKYIKELQKGGASSAEKFAETFRNTYGWNVMKPKAIDKEIWEGLYNIYVKDEYKMGLEKFFREKNPYALQEMTAVMLETIRKGYWKADDATIKAIAELHAQLVKDHKAGCSGFVCDNAKLREMIQNNIDAKLKEAYARQINLARTGEVRESKEGIKLEKEKITLQKVKEIVKENLAAVVTMLVIVLLFSFAVVFGAIKRRT